MQRVSLDLRGVVRACTCSQKYKRKNIRDAWLDRTAVQTTLRRALSQHCCSSTPGWIGSVDADSLGRYIASTASSIPSTSRYPLTPALTWNDLCASQKTPRQGLGVEPSLMPSGVAAAIASSSSAFTQWRAGKSLGYCSERSRTRDLG